MKHFFTTKRICRAGIVAALYVALTCSFGVLSFQGLFQIRPAEALCILPIFYPETILSLWLGCMLANIISLYGTADIFLGSFVTLVSAFFTFLVGKMFREEIQKPIFHLAKIFFGGLFPVVLNALIIPVIIVYITGLTEGFATPLIAYGFNALSLFVSESVWIFGLGSCLYFFLNRMRRKNVSAFLDQKIVKSE